MDICTRITVWHLNFVLHGSLSLPLCFVAEYMSAGGGGYSSYDNEDHSSSRGRRTPVTPPKKHSNVLPSVYII